MMNEALLLFIWAVDAIAIAFVLWLLAIDPGGRRLHSQASGQASANSDQAADRATGEVRSD
jgi:hypothetical protein